ERCVDRAQPLAVRPFGRDRRIVDQGVESAAGQASADLLDAAADVDRVGEVELDVVLAAARPRAQGAERLAREGGDAPAGGAELLDRGVADAAARPGQDQGARVVVQGCRFHRTILLRTDLLGTGPAIPSAATRHPERSEGSLRLRERSLAALAMT